VRDHNSYPTPGMADGIPLENACLALREKVDWQTGAPPAAMVEIFRIMYPPEAVEVQLQAQMRDDAPINFLLDAVRSGALRLWTVHADGREVLVHPRDCARIQRHEVVCGHWMGRDGFGSERVPMFVKAADFQKLIETLPRPANERNSNARTHVRAEAECARELARLFIAGDTRKRAELESHCLAEIVGLSAEGFSRAWGQVAKKHGRDRPGRPRKTPDEKTP
jgi:hypothetical protein